MTTPPTKLTEATAALTGKRMLGAEPAGEYSGLSPWTLRAYAYSGKIASYKIGTRLLFDIADLDAMIEAGRRPALQSSDKGGAE
jgi:hypothetical protein